MKNIKSMLIQMYIYATVGVYGTSFRVQFLFEVVVGSQKWKDGYGIVPLYTNGVG